ncbi:MAG: hypothetical protein H7250_10570 [Flavobacterium sp.]|nr:hypothetical protein [Flavobacterium sp.]
MKKIFCIFIYILSISCTTNTNQNKQISANKITLNHKQKETSNENAKLKNEALANWNSKGFFNRYKYWFLFFVAYSIIGSKLNAKTNGSIYDNRKTKTAYLYFAFSSLFGGQLIYLGKYLKYWFYSILLLTFLYLNTFNIISYYNNSSVLISSINEHLISRVILCLILFIFIFDLFTLSFQVFKINKSFRDNISPKIAKDREVSFLEIKKNVEKNNTLMLKEFKQWKK